MKTIIKKSFKTKVIFALVFAIGLLTSIDSVAQWSTNPYLNTPVCTAPGTQDKNVIAPDGSGGVIVAWVDQRTNTDIYAQRLDVNGNAKWINNGIAICTAAYFRAQTAIISDGSGGVIISWADYRNGNDYDIYAQRVDGNGLIKWTADGVGICMGQGDQTFPVMTSDGNGGAIITWIDQRNLATNNNDIYAQGINADGTLKWPQTIAISSNPDGVISPAITTDGSGGAIITWVEDMSLHNDTSAGDLYAQRLDHNGLTLWATDGVSICAAKRQQLNPVIATDGLGGAYISWVDERDISINPLNSDIYAQRVNANGVVQWRTNGIGISTTTEQQHSVKIISDQTGGAILAFLNWSGYVTTLITQHIDTNGSLLWGGYTIGSGGKGPFDLVSDNNGGALLTWEDSRNGAIDNYAQHLDATGAELWLLGGVLVSNAYGQQTGPHLVNDNSAGIIIVWDDTRNTISDIYAQHVKSDGTLGSNLPTGGILAITHAVSVYPNPFDQYLYIDGSSIKSTLALAISILDISGKTLETFSGKGIVKLNLGKYESNVYLLQIRDGNEVETRLIRKK